MELQQLLMNDSRFNNYEVVYQNLLIINILDIKEYIKTSKMDNMRKGNAVKDFRESMREKHIAKYGDMILPHLIPGDSRDSILEYNPFVEK